MMASRPARQRSRGRRIAGVTVLAAALGLTGWGAAAGSLDAVPGSGPQSLHGADRQSESPGPSSSTPADSSGSTTSGAPGTAGSPTSLQLTQADSTPLPLLPEPQGPAPRASTQTARVAPGPARATTPADAGTATARPPVASGKIIDRPPPVAVAKGFGKRSDVADGVSVVVAGLKAVEGEARGPGEVAGPAVQFTLEVTNTTTRPISLADAIVNVEAGTDRFPAELLSGPGTVPFPGAVPPGKTVSGVVVFQIPPEQRNAVRVLFHYQAVTPVAAFDGSAPLEGEAP